MNFAIAQSQHLMVHPLKVPVRRMLLGTIALSTAIALAITAFGSHRHGFQINFVFSQCIGLITYALIDLPRRRLWPAGPPPVLPMIALVLAAAVIGWFGGSMLGGWILGMPGQPGTMNANSAIGFFVLTAAAGFAGTYHFWTRERIAAIERGAAEARLKLLQAQIEPHFLFNTLANLQALIAIDPPRAQTMLSHLDTYLRATLAATRRAHGTLAEEFALLRGYLEIIAIRMGARLAFELDLPPALGAAAIAPMLLQPLVENAIRHGLEPRVEGGRVRVAARAEGAALVLTIEDTGMGLAAAANPGAGLGLANVRQRLAALYGTAAALEITDNPEGGTQVTMRVPRQPREKSA